MNILRSFPSDGPQPARFTTYAYLDNREAINGLFERTELLDGVIFEMASDGPRTRLWNRAINLWLVGALPEDLALVSHQTLPLSEHWAPSPDHYIFPEAVGDADVQAADVLLVIEVSDTTLNFDLNETAEAYAEAGIREYWVIDPEERCVHAHELGADSSYTAPKRISFTQAITAQHIPNLTLRLADLPRIK